MAQDTMTYIISNIKQSIPAEILSLAFTPRKYNTTVEQRIIAEIINGPIILDTNLVGGKRRDIYLRNNWEMNLEEGTDWGFIGPGLEGSFYKIPPEAREGRNISSVVGVNTTLDTGGFAGAANINGRGGFGNTATGMLSQMLNTYTFAQTPRAPQVSLEGTNIIRLNPRVLVEGIAVTVMLEYDTAFLNMNASAIMAMSALCLCATQRYIATKLRVSIDETEVVGGMEIGVVKTIVEDYLQKGEQYHELLMKLKGAMHYDARTRAKLIRYGL